MQNLITGALTVVGLAFTVGGAALGGGITRSWWESRSIYQISFKDSSFKMGAIVAATLPLSMVITYLVTVIWEKITKVRDEKDKNGKKDDQISSWKLVCTFFIVLPACNIFPRENLNLKAIPLLGAVLGMGAAASLWLALFNLNKSDSATKSDSTT